MTHMLPGVQTGVPVFAGYTPQYGAPPQLVVSMAGGPGMAPKPTLPATATMLPGTVVPNAPFMGGMAPSQHSNFVVPMPGALPMPVSTAGPVGMPLPAPYTPGLMGNGALMSGYAPSGVQHQWHDPPPRPSNGALEKKGKKHADGGAAETSEANGEGETPTSE
jgi:hypothetical protein